MLRFTLNNSLTPPGVGETCSRRRFRRSACRSCADACPVQAIVFTDSGPVLDNSTCIQCGHCLFACPVGALRNLSGVARHYQHDRLVAPFSRCPASALELLVWHTRHGIRGVEMELDHHPAWGREIAQLNLHLQTFAEPIWCVYPPQTSRVDALRRKMLQANREEVRCHAVRPEGNTVRRAFPNVSAFEVTIDSSACLLCGACFRTCPEAVFTVAEKTLSIRHQFCSGCGICNAVCPHNAISANPHIHHARQDSISYYQNTCQRCSSVFSSWNGDTSECPICRQHHYGMR